jgi:exoribonuclease-2
LPAASRRFTAGDLVGLHDDSRSLLAVVVAEKGTRLDLKVGFEAKALQRGVRQLDLRAALPGDQPPPSRLSQPPWGLSPETLQQATPSPRELGAAWLLLLDDPASLDLGDFVDLIGDGSNPTQRAACWLWLQGPQTLFRWRQQQVEARPLVDVRRLRRDARRQQLAEQRRRQWQDALRQRRPIDPQQLDPEQCQHLALLREWASGDTSRPLPDDLHRALQAAHCPMEASPIRHLLVDLG